jgi:hypothetical protein
LKNQMVSHIAAWRAMRQFVFQHRCLTPPAGSVAPFRMPVCSTTRAKSAIVSIRDRLFIDDRRLRLSRLPDFWQVAAGQDCQEARCHAASKRTRKRLAK